MTARPTDPPVPRDPPEPPDQAARNVLRGRGKDDPGRLEPAHLETSFFVSAGAGTGKTTAVVARIVARVAAGGLRTGEDGVERRPLGRIVAVTFTEKAAGELKVRVREALDRNLRDAAPDDRHRWEEALEDLETASIGTIHGFAAALLREFPLEAEIDPGFRVLDEMEAGLLTEEVWARWLGESLEGADDDHPIVRALLLGFGLDAVRDLALGLLEKRAFLDGVAAPAAAPTPPAAEVLDRLRPIAERLRDASGGVDDSKFAERLDGIAAWVEGAAGLDGLSLERYLLDRDPYLKNVGPKKGAPPARGLACDLVAEMALDVLTPYRERAGAALAAGLARTLLDPGRGLLAAYARAKAAEGVLDFDDLLAGAAALLAGPHARRVLGILRSRWSEIVVDEFQDTDPLQAAIVRALGDGDGAPTVVLVGDPKQSIYRFRRADIETFQAVRKGFHDGETGARRILPLTTNFRAVGDLTAWVNETFAPALGRTSIPYEPIEPAPRALGRVGGPAVRFLRCAEPSPDGTRTSDGILRAEAEGIARHLVRLESAPEMIRPWGSETGADPRPFAWGDAAILMRTFTGVERYAEALERAGIPFRLLGGKGFFGAAEVQALVQVLRAVASPADGLAVAGALRSMAFGLSDPDLLLLAEAGVFRGRPGARLPAGAAAAAAALLTLAALREEARRLPLASLAEAAIGRTGLRLAAAASGAPDQPLANLQKAVEILRAFEGAGRGSVADAAAFLAERMAEEADEVEAASSDERDSVVRIITVHRAKGLEFPVVYLAGMHGQEGRAPHVLVAGRDGRRTAEVRLGAKKSAWTLFEVGERSAVRKRSVEVPSLDGALPRSTKAYVSTPGFTSAFLGAGGEAIRGEEEETRLAYVAATRARDVLVVPLPYPAPPKEKASASEPDPPWFHVYGRKRFIEKIEAGVPSPEETGPAARVGSIDVGIVAAAELPGPGGTSEERPLGPDAARRLRADLLARLEAARARIIAGSVAVATASGAAAAGAPTDDGPDGPPEDPADHPAARRPRARRARIGRAVHAALSRVDLRAPGRLEEQADRAAAEEGIVDAAGLEAVRRLVRAAAAPEVAGVLAGATALHREVPFVLRDGGHLAEGVVDLVAETPDGPVVLDWKTDAVEGAADAERKAALYRPQVEAYARAVAAAFGAPPVRRLLVFLSAGRVVEV